jgi:acyl carrier protein
MQSIVSNAVFDKVVLAIERTTFVQAPGISPFTRLVDDLVLGGFGRLKLAIYLEEVFDVELRDEALERFVTVSDVVDYFSGLCFRDIEPPVLAIAA